MRYGIWFIVLVSHNYQIICVFQRDIVWKFKGSITLTRSPSLSAMLAMSGAYGRQEYRILCLTKQYNTSLRRTSACNIKHSLMHTILIDMQVFSDMESMDVVLHKRSLVLIILKHISLHIRELCSLNSPTKQVTLIEIHNLQRQS